MPPFRPWRGLDFCGERGRGGTGEEGFRRCHVRVYHESKGLWGSNLQTFSVMLVGSHAAMRLSTGRVNVLRQCISYISKLPSVELSRKYFLSSSTHVVSSILSMVLVSTLNSILDGQVHAMRYRGGWTVAFFGPDGGSYDIKRGDDYRRFHVKSG